MIDLTLHIRRRCREPVGLAVDRRTLRQDRITDRREGLRDQGRADGARRVAAADRQHAAAKPDRHRGIGKQIAREIDDALGVVFRPEPCQRIIENFLGAGLVEAHRPANPGMEAHIFGERNGDDAGIRLGLEEHIRLAVWRDVARPLADIERGVRPGRLREVFDGGGKPAIALDQEDVAGLQRFADNLRIWRIKRCITPGRLRYVVQDLVAEVFFKPSEHEPNPAYYLDWSLAA